MGSLRIARVNRRPSLDELSAEDAETAVAVALSSGAPLPPQLLPTSKKARTGKLSASSEAAQLEYDRLSTAVAFKKNQSNGGGGGPQLSNLGVEEWNLANFKMLTDCVSTLADHHDKRRRDDSAASDSSHGNSALGNSVHGGSISGSGCGSGSGSSASNAAYAQLQQQQHQQYHQMLNAAAGLQGSVDPQVGSASVVSGGSKEDLEVDSEFVCVIRTSDSYYARYSTRSDLFMFVSTPLSTATMEAHDQKPGNAIARHATLGGTGASYGKASSHGSSAGSVGVAQTNGNGVAGDEHRIASAVYRLVSSGSGSRSHDSSTLLPDSLSSGSGGISNSISSKSKDNTSSEEGSEDNTGGESSST